MHGNCSCPHHFVVKVLMLIAWIAGILFFWTSWRMVTVWGFESPYYAWVVVVSSLLALTSKYCGCYGRGSKMMEGGKGGMCMHGDGCGCGDCDRCK